MNLDFSKVITPLEAKTLDGKVTFIIKKHMLSNKEELKDSLDSCRIKKLSLEKTYYDELFNIELETIALEKLIEEKEKHELIKK